MQTSRKLKQILTIFLIFIILCSLVQLHHPVINLLDQSGFHFTDALPASSHQFWKQITALGAPSTICWVTVILVLLAQNWSQRLFLSSAVFFNLATAHWLKLLFCRPRPQLHHLIHVSGYSFPSGHANAITVLVLAIYLLYWQKKPPKGAALVGTLVVVGVLLSRVVLHVHYLSDVLAGSLYAIATTKLIWWLFFDNQSIISYYANPKD